MSSNEVCLLIGATGVGKTLLLKRLLRLSLHGAVDVSSLPHTLPTVGSNLTDLTLRRKKLTVREVGGCMGPIWRSYFSDCASVIFVVDSANIAQVSSSCIQLLTVLSDDALRDASVLIIFNKRDMPCTMSLAEIRSLFRLDELAACAPQPIGTLETSALSGTGLREVLTWLESVVVK
ncbi:ADP-ribosylation factor-like protein 16 [Syngnathoides biaculeatus]|uniref:ADP-ribosylation factor-like protein 16 n=1 Tax=Syngnathoides biaculeatus TaxID=300417 RepID=UPI002ADD5E9D|nr:ADP-ribosylation factor-like protein 16 [Syngnathoides biaculeatus]